MQPPCVQQNASITWNDTAGSAGTYTEGVGLGVTFLTWHANISSPAPGVYVQPVVLCGLSCSSRLCPRTGGNETAGIPVDLFNACVHLNWIHWVIWLKQQNPEVLFMPAGKEALLLDCGGIVKKRLDVDSLCVKPIKRSMGRVSISCI